MKVIRQVERPLILVATFAFVVAVTLILLSYAIWVIVDIILALTLAAVFNPIVRVMRIPQVPRFGWRIPKWLAVLIIYFIIVLILGAIGYFIEVAVVPEIRQLITGAPNAVQRFAQEYEAFRQASGLQNILPSEQQIVQGLSSAISSIGSALLSSLSSVEAAISSVIFFFVQLALVLILTVFLVEEADVLLSFWIRLFPEADREFVWVMTGQVGDKVGYWILGQITVAVTSGIIAGLGSYLLGLPFPVLLGLGVTILDLIPMVGPSVMTIPAGLLALAISPLTTILTVILFVGLSVLDGHVFSPLITGRFVQLPLSVIIIAVPFGLALYGPLGALLAIPVAAGASIVVNEWFLPWLHMQEERPFGGRHDDTASEEA
ncbi:MAG: AI-2E family transporter [Dehalococcoidales bacterium]|nr:AI-2E family transporter [Dehalococcoidales bacterium]